MLVDRTGFSPGEIDGRTGRNTQAAIAAFEREARTTIAEALAAATDPVTITYTITAEDASAPMNDAIPEDMMAKAPLKRLDYTSILEMLAERFHASPALLKRLNPSARYVQGEQIEVPNVIVTSSTEAKPVPDIVVRVSKQMSVLTVTDMAGKVLMHAPEPSTVGHTTSHGCVRLTNWDALRLAALVGKGTRVEFAE